MLTGSGIRTRQARGARPIHFSLGSYANEPVWEMQGRVIEILRAPQRALWLGGGC